MHPRLKVVGLVFASTVGIAGAGVGVAAFVCNWGIPLIVLWGSVSGVSFFGFLVFLCFRQKKPQVQISSEQINQQQDSSEDEVLPSEDAVPQKIQRPKRRRPPPKKRTAPPQNKKPAKLKRKPKIRNTRTKTRTRRSRPSTSSKPSTQSSRPPPPKKTLPPIIPLPWENGVDEGLLDCPATQLLCIPYVGLYKNDYPMGQRVVTIPLGAEILEQFPQAIQTALQQQKIANPEIYFIIYDDSNLKIRTRHYVLHPWLWPGTQYTDVAKEKNGLIRFAQVGIYNVRNVTGKSDRRNRWLLPEKMLRVEHMLHIEGGMSLSPHTAKFNVNRQQPTSSFYSLAIDEETKRAVVTFSIFVHSTNSEGDGRTLVQAINDHPNDMDGLIEQLKESGSFDPGLLGDINNVMQP